MRVSKSAVFLFELMVIILVFTLAAAICTQIFASAYNMSKESHELTMSSINAQTVAERFKADIADPGEIRYFDRDWKATDRMNAYYWVMLEETAGTEKTREAWVNVYEQGIDETIFSLHVKEYAG